MDNSDKEGNIRLEHLDQEVSQAIEASLFSTRPADETEEELYTDEDFQKILADRATYSTLSEVEQATVRRWAEIEALREHYALFEDFLYDCMTELMGFRCSDVQVDIGRYLQSDVQNGMIQAQRSQAKSTIVAMFAVWQLIHDCRHRILIVSAGSEVAMEIANWVIQIIMGWDILEAMRPDRQHGDRASGKAFDIHWQLKGAEKSPSIACIGITANMQGRRADLLIPDDIESSKNGITENQRAALEHLSKDFTSICQKGRIIYLGTPQTVDSIYNNLPSRGFDIRVWPGRYPTEKEMPHYEGTLAPYLLEKLRADPTLQEGGGLARDRGKPIDPLLLDEGLLQTKERDQGTAYFNLQHMLNTTMSDELRNPLKTKNLIVTAFGTEEAYGAYGWSNSVEYMVDGYTSKYQCRPDFYRPMSLSEGLYKYEGKHMYVDTAGGGKNGDETVAAVTYFLHGYIFLAEILKVPGGYSEENYKKLSQLSLKHRVNSIDVEKNFGFGAFAAAWRPVLLKSYNEQGLNHCPAIEDVWESGQKELRIIDTLEPVLARHRLILHEDIIEYDLESVVQYPVDQRESYKFIHQFSKITRDKGALVHDDSLDAVAGSVRKWVTLLAIDETKRIEQKETDDNVAFFAEWGGDIGKSKTLGNSADRFSTLARRRQQQKSRLSKRSRFI